jgi:hypothetical protein
LNLKKAHSHDGNVDDDEMKWNKMNTHFTYTHAMANSLIWAYDK